MPAFAIATHARRRLYDAGFFSRAYMVRWRRVERARPTDQLTRRTSGRQRRFFAPLHARGKFLLVPSMPAQVRPQRHHLHAEQPPRRFLRSPHSCGGNLVAIAHTRSGSGSPLELGSASLSSSLPSKKCLTRPLSAQSHDGFTCAPPSTLPKLLPVGANA